ncbi:MAG: DNA topoisomerase IB [Acidobacteria bacterium]|nr:DNA topoisomerase IB [Acidobacteriota bacterium]
MTRQIDDPQAVAADPVLSARLAGLRYVTDEGPGIRRRRQGTGFSYRGPDGQALRDRQQRRRIAALAIPPAWTEVWICPLVNGHLQATGRDARGRKQYRYHPDWRAVRDETKFGRMIAFGEALPRLRDRIAGDLALPGLPREKVLAAVVRLLETTLIRVGNQEYARENRSFGLTTLRSRHVAIAGATLRFRFRGKSGKEHNIAVADRRLARVVRACRELPGHELFQYVDESGERQVVDSEDVNAYLRAATGEDFSAKDFRTWGGTVLALSALLAAGGGAAGGADGAREAEGGSSAAGGADAARDAKRLVVEALEKVAAQLGNRPAICRKYYVHPAIIAAFLEGRLAAPEEVRAVPAAGGPAADGRRGLEDCEALTLALLRGLPAAEPAIGTRRKRRSARRRRKSEKKGRPGPGRSAAGDLES